MMNKQKLLSILLGLALVIICLSPILKSGLYSDDLFNFQHKTLYNTAHPSNIYELAVPNINYWKSIGRYTPVSFVLMEFVYKYFISVESYKLFVWVMNILAVIAFLFYLSSLKIKLNYGIWLVCFGAVTQFRISYHDSFTSLNGMYQLLAIFIFTASALYAYSIYSGKYWMLIFPALLFTLGILESEIGLTTLFIIPVTALILKTPFKKFILTFSPFVLIAMMYLGYTFWLRTNVNAQDAYIGLTSNFDFVSMRNLFYKQLYAAVPLSNLHNKFAIPIILFHQLHDVKNIIGILFIVFISWLIFRNDSIQKKSETQPINWVFFLLSFVLIASPALFILPSVKYQLEMKWGIGYLPVFIQIFGSATFFAYLIQICFYSRKWIIQRFSNLIFILMVCCSCIALLFNQALINSRSFTYAYPAQTFYESIKGGILNNCKEGSTIVLGNNFFWKNPNNYSLIFKEITHKEFRVLDAESSIPVSDSTDCYLLDCRPGKTVVVSLYKINCIDKKPISFIQKVETACDIDMIEEEKTIANY
jgi:hypothetical protein